MAEDVRQLLTDWQQDDQEALNRLIPIVHDELHYLAHYHLRMERVGHTLQTTELVQEVYLRLVKVRRFATTEEMNFRALAATLMRRILIEYARKHKAKKNWGGMKRVTFEEPLSLRQDRVAELIDLDRALNKLAESNARASRVIELGYFGGLSGKEIAQVLGVTEPTVSKDEKKARLWLLRELNGQVGH